MACQKVIFEQIQKMVNGNESEYFSKDLTGTNTVKDALEAYKKGNLITWFYGEYQVYVHSNDVGISKLRLQKPDFLQFIRAINDQMTDSQISEIFQYYIRTQVATQTKIAESKSSARHKIANEITLGESMGPALNNDLKQ